MSTSRQTQVVSGWQLLLLGATSIVLSVASGWTTWDGMRNFTKEPVLSLMITFGIQGVMLIAAWLIGDSFARERAHPDSSFRTHTTSKFATVAGTGLLILLALAAALSVLVQLGLWPGSEYGAEGFVLSVGFLSEPWFVVFAVMALATVVALTTRDIVYGYLRSVRIIARNVVLWAMFLACMATSVFFSFDSLFSTIFSDDERLRAADLRTRSAVASIVADVVDTASRRQTEQRTALLNSNAWRSYSDILDGLAKEAQSSSITIDQHLRQYVVSSQESAAKSRARLLGLENDAAQNLNRKEELSRQLSRQRDQVKLLQAETDTLKQSVFEKDREIIAKTAEAEAEATGIGQSETAGRGPRYRELIEQLNRLKAEKKNLELQLDAYAARLSEAQNAVTEGESSLTEIVAHGERLQFQIEAEGHNTSLDEQTTLATALGQNIQAAQQSLTGQRASFEQDPTRGGLVELQSACSRLVGIMSESALFSEKMSGYRCEPGPVHEAGVQLYALNEGVASLANHCDDAKTANIDGGIDSQLAYARNCLQRAHLSAVDASRFRSELNSVERTRDDVAHRFVVSANALFDGHNLAYLALAIAIAIDSLVFMSGLFGANAARSAEHNVPDRDPRVDRYAAETIRGALLPDVFENAAHALELVHPVSETDRRRDADPSWTHEIRLSDVDPSLQGRMRKLLNAGAATDTVRRDEKHHEHYRLRSNFVGLLCDAAQTALSGRSTWVRPARPEHTREYGASALETILAKSWVRP